MTVDPYIIASLLEVSTSPSESGEPIVGVVLNWSCASCWVNLIFTRRQFNLLWLTLPWGGWRDLRFPSPGGAITSEIISSIPAGIICLQPKLMLWKCLAQSLCPRASVCCHNLAHIMLKKKGKWGQPRCCYISAVDKHLGWRCWQGGIQTPTDEQSNVHSLFILGFPIVSVCHGRRLACSLCLPSCESEFWKCMKKNKGN